MRPQPAGLLAALLVLGLGSAGAAPTAAPAEVVGGPVTPPPRLPPARSCRDALNDSRDAVDHLPGQVNGAAIAGAAGLRRLRQNWRNALVVVRNGSFARADLRGARLHNICFVGTDFSGSDWRGAIAPGIGFVESELKGSKLQGARMPGVFIRHPHLEGVDATGADLSGGYVDGNALGSWDKLRLDGAKLRGFRFQCGSTQGDQCVGEWSDVSFRRADLTGADVASFWGTADWRGARFERTRIDLRQLLQIGPGLIAGPLIVIESGATARIARKEYRWLRPHMSAFADSAPGKGLGMRPRLAPGETALYLEPPIRFDTAARRHRLYRRLLPAFVAASASRIRVTAGRDGILAAEGNAAGANGHSCGLSAKGLRFDRRTGWFLATPEPPATAPAPLLRFEGDTVEVRGQGHETPFYLCGARASFRRMERLALSQSVIRTMLAAHPEFWGFDGP